MYFVKIEKIQISRLFALCTEILKYLFMNESLFLTGRLSNVMRFLLELTSSKLLDDSSLEKSFFKLGNTELTLNQ